MKGFTVVAFLAALAISASALPAPASKKLATDWNSLARQSKLIRLMVPAIMTGTVIRTKLENPELGNVFKQRFDKYISEFFAILDDLDGGIARQDLLYTHVQVYSSQFAWGIMYNWYMANNEDAEAAGLSDINQSLLALDFWNATIEAGIILDDIGNAIDRENYERFEKSNAYKALEIMKKKVETLKI